MEERKIRVLFICVHNSARSQMAETFLKSIGGEEKFHVESAGFKPTEINPLVVDAMKDEGFDLSDKKTQNVFNLFKQGILFDYVITVCGETEDSCPVFPGTTKRLHWAFDDPKSPEQTRAVRDEIKNKIRAWVPELEV